MQEDTDGSKTIQFLENVRNASSRIAGIKPQSLGLHPAVYFYSATGNYQPTAFLAAVRLALDLERSDELNVFTQFRHDFEELLVRHKYLINQIVRKLGAGQRSLTGVSRLFRHVFDGIRQGKNEEEIIPKLVEEETMGFLKPIIDFDKGTNPDFTTERKSAVFLTQALKTAMRCGICRARLHKNSMNLDHVVDKRHGGLGSEDNAVLTHPYCNSTYKEWSRKERVVISSE
ncbi:MAG: HNH endonuclease, partial [Acidobacteriaceae bacterium]